MKNWIVIHLHKFGNTAYLVEGKREPTLDDVINKVLECEFDEDNEFIEIHPAGKIKKI